MGWGRENDPIRRAFAVEDDALFCGDHTEVQVVGPNQATLFVTSKNYLDGAVGSVGRQCRLQALKDDGNSGFAVAAQDGGAVRPQNATVNHWLDAPARLDSVQVSREHDWFALSF